VIPQSEWMVSVEVWNYMNPGSSPVEIEHVEECLLAFTDWQRAIYEGRPGDHITELLCRHHEFARRLPDQLVLVLTEEDETWDDEG
jgi:hypothetical protein